MGLIFGFIIIGSVLRHVSIVERVEELKKVGIIDKKVKFEDLKYFHFQLNEFDVIDTTTNLKCLVIVVHLIMELSGQDKTGQKQFMNIQPSKREIPRVQVIPVNINQRQYQTLRLEACFLVNAVDVYLEVDVFE